MFKVESMSILKMHSHCHCGCSLLLGWVVAENRGEEMSHLLRNGLCELLNLLETFLDSQASSCPVSWSQN